MVRKELAEAFPYNERDPFQLPIIQGLSQEIDQNVPDVVSSLLWGSITYGSFDPLRSDIDFMLILEDSPQERGLTRLERIQKVHHSVAEIERRLVEEGVARPNYFVGLPNYLTETEIPYYFLPFLSRITMFVEKGVFRPFVGKSIIPYLPTYSQEELMKDALFNMETIKDKTQKPPSFLDENSRLSFITKRAVYFLRLAELVLLDKVTMNQVEILENAVEVGKDWESVLPTMIELFGKSFAVQDFPLDEYRQTLLSRMEGTLAAVKEKGVLLTPEERRIKTIFLQHARTTEKVRKDYVGLPRESPTLLKIMTGEGYAGVSYAYQSLRQTFLSFLFPEDLERLARLEKTINNDRLKQAPNETLKQIEKDPLRIFTHEKFIPFLPEETESLNFYYEGWYAPAIEDFLRWYLLNRMEQLRELERVQT